MTRQSEVLAAPHRAKNARPTSVRSLRTRLDALEQTLAAIRGGDVDGLVMRGPDGERLFTMEGADHGYRVLLEAMSEGVAKLSREGAITYCNSRFASILSLPVERAIGSTIYDVLLPKERARFASLLAAGAHERSQGEFILVPPGAPSEVPVRVSVMPLVTRGAPMHCLVMCDITEERKHSDAIAAERAAMHARLLLADRMLSMGMIAAGVAHEINNPLAYVIGSLELMISRLPDLAVEVGAPTSELVSWLRRQLERAQEGAARVRVIVRDLKAFSRADDETVKVIDPRVALDTSIALVSNEIRLRARLVQDYDGLPAVRANEARLGQVFVNLLVNAAHAIQPGAADRNEISVSGRADAAGNAMVEVRDTGSGIGAENLDRIFEPFFTTKAVGTGTGLGLALCHGIVCSLGGQITVESSPGAGSLFRVVIPAAAAEADDAETVAPASRADSRGRLLVVDDERDLCEVMKELLANFHDVVTTSDACEALDWIAAGERFDMILCDMAMPEMTGLDLRTRLAATNPDQADRLVLMSGASTEDSGDPSAIAGPVLEKPFETEQVRMLMRLMMGRGPRPAALPRDAASP